METFIKGKVKDNKRNKIKTRNVRMCIGVFAMIFVLLIWLVLLRKNIKSIRRSIQQMKENINNVECERKDNEDKLKREIDSNSNYKGLLMNIESEINTNVMKFNEYKVKYEDMKHNREEVNERILSLQNKISKQSFDIQDNKNEIQKLQRTYSDITGKPINIMNNIEDDINNDDDSINSIVFSKIVTKEQSDLIEKVTRLHIGNACYKGEYHSLSTEDFHNMCDNIQHTVTFVKTSYGDIVGGYTSISWKGNTKQRDPSAFIFNILNKHIFTPYTNTYSIYPNENTFPSFGEDLYFGNDDGNGYSSFPSVYGSSANTLHQLISHNIFKVSHIEQLFGVGSSKPKSIKCVLLGLDNAGKTTTLKAFNGETVKNHAPTKGFGFQKLMYNNTEFLLWDLGGQKAIRNLWENYYQQCDAIIYVIDSSDNYRLDETGSELYTILQTPELSGIPLLIFANKQDLNLSLDCEEIIDALNLTRIIDRTWTIIASSAVTKQGLCDGLNWIIKCIEHINKQNNIN